MQKYLGEMCILISCLLLAISTIISHQLVIRVNPIVVIFYSFLFAVLMLNFFQTKHGKQIIPQLSRNWQLILILNLSTAIDWILMFIALQYISGSLVNCFVFGISPVATLFLSLKTYTNRRQFRKDFIITSIVCLILIFLALVYYQNLDQTLSREKLLLGIFLGILSGIATAVTVLSSKGLHKNGFGSINILKSRYYLLLIATFLIILILGLKFAVDYKIIFVLFSLSLIFVIIPAFLGQVGIAKTTPVAVMIISSLTPVLTYILQIFEPHFQFHMSEFSLIFSLSVLICIATRMKTNEI